MPARANASGTIAFGLVSIPVKLYSATRPQTVRFNLLDRRDNSRVKQQYVNAATGEPVERGEMVKGYEFARGRYVVMTDEELKALETKTDNAIEIEEFVPIEKVDPVYFERAQLLGPDKGGQKAYRLLHQAMTAMGKVAVGRHATRGREQLVLIRPMADGLVLHGLYYADEVRAFDDVDTAGDVTIKPGELDLARQLVEQLSHDAFEPAKYEDTYRGKVLAAVERKAAGEEIVAPPKEEAREQIIDLVAALKKSLAERQAAGAGRQLALTEAARLVGLREAQVRALVRSGLCRPARRGRRYAFTFQDLVVLRAARGLLERGVPAARVRRALAALARDLPADRPLSGVRIRADGRDVAVLDGGSAWQPETGQTLLAFDVDPLAEEVAALPRAAPQAGGDARVAARRAFEEALDQDGVDDDAARRAYRRALALDPELADAWVNLGRLLHEAGRAEEAVHCGEEALARSPDDPVVHFNLALALEEVKGVEAALGHYRRALELDPDFADAHYNLASLYEQLGRGADALRHYREYKKLTEE
jgi:DNA end-binding protein Ku